MSNNNIVPLSTPDGLGGGIYSKGALLTITNSTLSGNSAFFGGGIFGGTTVLESSTVTRNKAENFGGLAAGFITFGTLTARNSIVSGNQGVLGVPDDCGEAVSLGFNLIGACAVSGDLTGNVTTNDPRLGPLQINGGLTPTHALLPDSPAVDAGSPEAPGTSSRACPPADQRDVPRPQDGNLDGRAVCDIGAFEREGRVTFASLCALSRQLATNSTMAQGMCNVLNAAALDERLGIAPGKAANLEAYRRLVEAALRARFFSAEQAATLTSRSMQL